MKQLTLWYACFLLLTLVTACAIRGAADESLKVPVTFSGGHETDPRDKGRPVVLIAAALGVKPEVFRDAFSGVKPAEDGKPTSQEVERNKQVLLTALKPFGITNERLDKVSDYYRYRPGKGNLWKTTPAKAYAVVEGGKVKGVVITDQGSGYSSPPTATVQGMETVKLKVTIRFSKELRDNGAVSSVEVE
jgi:hypothetical protein